jgi:hypothetical protein
MNGAGRDQPASSGQQRMPIPLLGSKAGTSPQAADTYVNGGHICARQIAAVADVSECETGIQ